MGEPVPCPGSGLWFACEQPERPTDPFVMFHYDGCRACRLVVDMLVRMHPDDSHVAWLDRRTDPDAVGD